jgi:two-component system sensor histidine kinase DesK
VGYQSRRRFVGLFFTCIYLVFVAYIVIGELESRDSRAEQVATLAVLALFVAGYVAFWNTMITQQGWHCERPRLRAGIGAGLCAIALGLSLVDFQTFGGLLIYCAAVVAGMLQGRQAVLAVFAVTAVVVVFILLVRLELLVYSYIVLISLLTGFSVIFGRLMGQYTSDLRLAREEIARLAVSEERLRFARDLHDLLGHSLSVVVLKAELAGRLATTAPDRAAEEMSDVERVAREALREVRDAVAGYRQPSLDQELEGARQILQSAGVLARFEPVAGPLPATLDATMAWALREGVTNVVRHSGAHHAEVLLSRSNGQVHLELLDDGAGCDGCEPGNGLRGLRERVEARDGSLESGPRAGGGFRLAVTLPLKDAPRAAVRV